MTPADRCETVARVLRDMPVPDYTGAVIELLALVMIDMIRTSPRDQASKLAAIAKAIG